MKYKDYMKDYMPKEIKSAENLSVRESVHALCKIIANDIALAAEAQDADRILDSEFFAVLVAAYNEYAESECGGANYLFNITDKNDWITCFNGGASIEELTNVWSQYQAGSGATPYFFFGHCHEKPVQFMNAHACMQFVIDSMSDVLFYVIAYPYACKAYSDLYKEVITSRI